MKIHKISAHHNSLQKLNLNSQKQQNKAINEDNKDVEQQVQQLDYKSNECEQQFSNLNQLKVNEMSEHFIEKQMACD
jgi:hypothetical protein